MYLNNTQLSSFFLDYEYATFVDYQVAISDLIETNLINCVKTKTLTRYKLTEEGKSTIDYFQNDLTKKMKDEIIEYVNNNKIKFKQQSVTQADFEEAENDNYKVHLEIEENKESVFTIEMTIPDIELAQKIVERWKNENNISKSVYEFIIKKLY